MSKNTGGAAFPSPGVILHGNQQGAYEGATLRDYFAAKALPVAMTTPWSEIGYVPVNGLTDIQQHARLAYQMADAMLAERAK